MMKNYFPKAILFDLDQTLYDLNYAQSKAFAEIKNQIVERGINSQKFFQLFLEIERKLFRDFLRKEAPIEKVRIERFYLPLRNLGHPDIQLAEQLNAVFMKHTNTEGVLFEDVISSLIDIHKKGIFLGVLTNGPSDGQWAKIRTTGLNRFVSHIFISEEIGCSKPDYRAFHFACRKMKVKACDTLFIGDNVEDDFYGSQDAGLRALLLDRNRNHPEIVENKISELNEIFSKYD